MLFGSGVEWQLEVKLLLGRGGVANQGYDVVVTLADSEVEHEPLCLATAASDLL